MRTSDDGLRKRITELESSLMHLQSDYESLNEVVLENSRRLQSLKDLVSRLNDQLEKKLANSESADVQDERPPHY